MQRHEWIEVYDTELKPAALTFAQGVAEQLAKTMTEHEAETILDGYEVGVTDEDFVKNILLPAFRREVFRELSIICTAATEGWNEVYGRNYNERYVPK